MKKHILLLALSFSFIYGNTQTNDSAFIRAIADEILLHGKAYDDLRFLTKQIGGRLSGSPQMVKAEGWGLQTLKALQPDNAWLQQCMVPHWVRGGKDNAVASISKNGNASAKNLDVIALGNSLGNASRPVTAEVIEIKNFDDL